jgi:hypothetical protein
MWVGFNLLVLLMLALDLGVFHRHAEAWSLECVWALRLDRYPRAVAAEYQKIIREFGQIAALSHGEMFELTDIRCDAAKGILTRAQVRCFRNRNPNSLTITLHTAP